MRASDGDCSLPKETANRCKVPETPKAMAKKMAFVYFDTDIFHIVGETFHNKPLGAALRDQILLSPITFIEVLSHLTLKKSGGDVLRHIQAVRNWVNTEDAKILPWPTIAIAKAGFNITLTEDDVVPPLGKAINRCLNADSVEELRESAGRLKDWLDKMKESSTQDFRKLVDAYRKKPLLGDQLSEVWVHGIAQRVKVDPASRPTADIVAALSAYHEYECAKVKVAAENRDYDPARHRNDLLDSEQLVYLADPPIHFLTCDGGYSKRVTKSEQAKRIHTASRVELQDATGAEALLAKVLW